MRTPIGTLRAVLIFQDDAGTLSGVAEGSGELAVPLRDLQVAVKDAADRVTWAQTVTKPMRLELLFDVTVDGDLMSGYSRAGRLPKSAVSGVRRQG
ncbi:hypothetical protein C5E07_16295 [Pseudoclavibacter sp. RFBJ3]|nr:hypothetical protein C5C12_00105 [Pseudoclavibacter sp. RFBJ5]PPF90418.1 hypothetical protein C5E07_16295 [Pseudoclavibacter sp. RFBJ3]PPG01140.1 hypothetical protein C5C19_00105 [Pseudoclavibacter sp. RFBH5]PPG26239.1 hypothetical protein C5E13_00060 [Pseudoclavibacter sp. RFBI4]